MNIITANEAKALLLEDERSNTANLDSIDFLTRNGIETEYLTVGGAVIINQLFRGEHFTNVCPLGEDCDPDELLAYLVENRRQVKVQIDVQKLRPDTKNTLVTRMNEHFTCRTTYTDAVYSGTADFPEDPAVRLLTEADRDAYLAMEYTAPKYRPPLGILFDAYVVNGEDDGKILAFFDGATVVGSLSYCTQSGKYRTVDYIWVAPSRRNEGIGSRLTAAYIREVTKAGDIPMWSNTRTEESKHLSEKYGFVPNRETLSFE